MDGPAPGDYGGVLGTIAALQLAARGADEEEILSFLRPEPGPEPAQCPYCGSPLSYRRMCDEAGRFQVWNPFPEPCTRPECQSLEAQEEARKKQLEMEAICAQKEKRLNEMVQLALRNAGVGARYMSATVSAFKTPTKALGDARDCAAQYIEHYDELAALGKGLYITGPPGTGKTFLAAAVVRELIKRGHEEVVFVSSYDLLDNVRASFGTEMRGDTETVVRRYKTIPLLVIDDLGKERLTEWGATILAGIVHARDAEMLPTIYTSNFSIDDITAALARGGEVDRAYAIASRIAGSTLYVPVIGQDRRRQQPI